MLWISLALLSAAVLVGAWRQFNGLVEMRHAGEEARAWSSFVVQMVSWLLVVLGSIGGVVMLLYPLDTLLAQILFGVLLATRWMVSALLAGRYYHRYYPEDLTS